MLTIEPARRRGAGSGKMAVALAGGGPLGAFYELGVLHALEEAIVGRDLTAFDVYVGVSSGSVIAAGLANGIDTTEMGAMFIHDTATVLPLTPEIMLHPALREYVRRIALLPGVLVEIGRSFARDPLRNGWPMVVSALGRAVPTALFDNRPLQRFLHAVFSGPDRSDDFRKLDSRLFVVATNLNTGAALAFGDSAHDGVPISHAVAASTALPGLYAPVEIGGEQYVDGALIRTMHASLACDEGCDLVICINPLVPFDGSRALDPQRTNLANAGLPVILGQTFRALIHSRMQVGMASYRTRFPKTDSLLFEPDRDDEKLFFSNVFRYTGRHNLVEHAYQRTRHDLLAQADGLSAVLRRHGLALDLKRLREKRRSFCTSGKERAQRSRQVAARLGRTLGMLEDTLSSLQR